MQYLIRTTESKKTSLQLYHFQNKCKNTAYFVLNKRKSQRLLLQSCGVFCDERERNEEKGENKTIPRQALSEIFGIKRR